MSWTPTCGGSREGGLHRALNVTPRGLGLGRGTEEGSGHWRFVSERHTSHQYRSWQLGSTDNCGWQLFMGGNPRKSCSCVESTIMEAEIKRVAKERRGEDGVEKCHRGEIERAWCPKAGGLNPRATDRYHGLLGTRLHSRR